MKTGHLTNSEIIQQLTLRDDLSELEHDLLDRLIRATDEMNRIEDCSMAREPSLLESVIQP